MLEATTVRNLITLLNRPGYTVTYLKHSAQTCDGQIRRLQQKMLASWSINFYPRIDFKRHVPDVPKIHCTEWTQLVSVATDWISYRRIPLEGQVGFPTKLAPNEWLSYEYHVNLT